MARPKWDIEETIRGAIQLEHLGTKYRDVIEPRLAAGALAGFAADIPVLRGKARKTLDIRSDKKASTKTKQQRIAEASKIATSYRNSVRGHFSEPETDEIRQAFGLGEKVTTGMSSVSAALEMLISEAEANPETARAAAILPEDVELLQATLNGLTGVGSNKEVMTATSREATVDRDAAHLRVERHMTKLVAVAGIVFRDQPDVLAQFEAAIPASRGRRSKKKTDSEVPAP